ncbi:hypothetical protein NDK47_21415 [Brevibacillus ruminantium]|uniref:Type 4 fimbrial biogenesis protein PilX N-terminal domain-containing protein n=1 Tax=Brevibacillus ruminantium TaxID=2950604 RepID=A0ABY4WJ41_9BACL|nr:hypothetical protein [Brevibacillus ruminantium]USG64676.1 hypothetical protein NDK47_21415 [Brevibacillus ruminantium]
MSRLRNEQGSALLLVLFIVVLFTVLGLSIFSYVVQSSRQHVFSEDEIQGKMLADMGLAYFQKYAEQNLSYARLADDLKSGSGQQEIKRILDRIAAEMNDAAQSGPYKQTNLPALEDGTVQGFAIGYRILGDEIRLQENPGQPYILKLHVSVIGIPARGSQDLSVVKSRVRLDSTVYINTIAAPFHYAVSTPGELRLFGGSNIIGNVTAHHVITAKEYRYSTENPDSAKPPVWNVDSTRPKENGRPYLEGLLSLSQPGNSADGLVSGLYQLKEGDLQYVTESANRISLEDIREKLVISNKKDLEELFSPKTLASESRETLLSAPADKPYEPGYEPPIVQNTPNTARPLAFQEGQTTGAFLAQQISRGKSSSDKTIRVSTNQSIQLEEHSGRNAYLNDGFRTVDIAPGTESVAILAGEPVGELDGATATVLTARLTGDQLESAGVRQLYIAPDSSDRRAMATVEMGRLGSFIPEASSSEKMSGDPFRFSGTIYIKGNLDIVGDISINGTIFVDGDVLIREITNLDSKNLAIVATGTISLTSRYVQETDFTHAVDSWKSLPPFSAFLYSEKSMEIYSIASFNRIQGGIATGSPDSYIELNTKREDKRLASRLAIQFNRRIFEAETPGLPSAEEFFVDLYDLQYSPHPGDVQITP